MDVDAIIGKLYRAVLEEQEQKKFLIDLIGAVKSKEIALDRIQASGNSVTVLPESVEEN